MIDARADRQAAVSGWLRVRANVRALAARLVAAEHRARCDAQRSGEAEGMTLVSQIAAERRSIETLAGELDARIADIRRTFAAHDREYAQALAVDGVPERKR